MKKVFERDRAEESGIFEKAQENAKVVIRGALQSVAPNYSIEFEVK